MRGLVKRNSIAKKLDNGERSCVAATRQRSTPAVRRWRVAAT